MEELVGSILGTGSNCEKCRSKMILTGKIKKRGKLVKVWSCTKCNHRQLE